MKRQSSSPQTPSQEFGGEAALEALRGLFRDSRIHAGLDLATLASNSLVSVDTIVLLETSPLSVRLEDLYAVANALNLDPGVVLDRMHAATR